MNNSFDLVVIGDTNLDLVLKVERFPGADDEVEAGDVILSAGGDAANTAVQASRLGLRTLLISSIGADNNGKWVSTAMQSTGVDLSTLQVIEGLSTGLVISEVTPDGQRAMIAARGANTWLQLDESDASLIREARMVHICDPQPQIVNTLPGLIQASSVFISLDPGSIGAKKGLDYLLPLLRISRCLFVNRNELYLLTQETDPLQAAQTLLTYGPDTIFVKCGAEGCCIITKKRQLSIPAFQVRSIDSTGAGDAFNAAALFALDHAMPIEEAGRFANAVGAMTTLGFGAQTSQPDLAQVQEFLAGK